MKRNVNLEELIRARPEADARKIAEALAILQAAGCSARTEYTLELPYARHMLPSVNGSENEPPSLISAYCGEADTHAANRPARQDK